MNVQTQEVLQAALALGRDDRSLVADLLYGSLNQDADSAAIDELWSQEVARRIGEVDAGKERLLHMDEVEKRLRDTGVLWQ